MGAGQRTDARSATGEAPAAREPVGSRAHFSALEAAERLEPRVDVVVRVVVVPSSSGIAADDAQAGAVGAAERRDRLGELDRLADRRLEVELVVIGQAERLGLLARAGDRRAGVDVDRRQGLFLDR